MVAVGTVPWRTTIVTTTGPAPRAWAVNGSSLMPPPGGSVEHVDAGAGDLDVRLADHLHRERTVGVDVDLAPRRGGARRSPRWRCGRAGRARRSPSSRRRAPGISAARLALVRLGVPVGGGRARRHRFLGRCRRPGSGPAARRSSAAGAGSVLAAAIAAAAAQAARPWRRLAGGRLSGGSGDASPAPVSAGARGYGGGGKAAAVLVAAAGPETQRQPPGDRLDHRELAK